MVKKVMTAVVLSGALVFGTAGSCESRPTEYYETELPDCDADDRSPHWEVADCGPSPRPMKTAYQPKPTPKPRVTRR
jgi:hypothetical protein